MDGQSALNLKEFTRQEHAPTIGLLLAPAPASCKLRACPATACWRASPTALTNRAGPASALARKLASAAAGDITPVGPRGADRCGESHTRAKPGERLRGDEQVNRLAPG